MLAAAAVLPSACSPSRAPSGQGAAQKAAAPDAESAESAAVFGHWIHSHEEDSADNRVYRPQGYPLPPSRGRTGFELFPDGRALLHAPGPADRGESTAVRWEALAPDTLRLVDASGTERFRIVILELAPERLVARIERSSQRRR